MKRRTNIEKAVRINKSPITTSRRTDKRILDDSFAAMEAAQAKSAGAKPNVWAMVLRSRITKVAAIIAIVAGLVLVLKDPDEQAGTIETAQVVKSPAEMLTFMSLTMAYRRGGIEAIEQQCEKAFEMLGPRPAAVSTQDLLKELNGL
jgi:hypothetical protein